MALGKPDGWTATGVYGLAHLGKSLFWYAGELLFAFYLIELVGLSPSRTGVVLALGLLVSAILDLAVARFLRRELNDTEPAARLQFTGSILCAVTFLAVFAGFWVPAELRFTYALMAGVAFRVAYAIYDLPQNALMALATSDPLSRDRVAATRIWFSGVATLMVAGAVGPLIAGRDEDSAWLYLVLAAAIALPAVLGAGLLAWVVLRSAPSSDRVHSDEPYRPFPWPRGFWLLLALMLATSLTTPLFSKVEPFFAVYVLQSPVWGGLIVVSMALGIILGQPLWTHLARRDGRRRVLTVAALTQVGALMAFWLLSPDGRWTLAIAAFFFGLGNGGVGMALWGGFSEVVARFSARGEAGAAYALFTTTAKVALALGSLGLGATLEALASREGDPRGLVALMTVVPALGAVACLAISTMWRQTERR